MFASELAPRGRLEVHLRRFIGMVETSVEVMRRWMCSDVARRGSCRSTQGEVERSLHVNMQIDRLVRCHMQVRIAGMQAPRLVLFGAGLSWHCWHPAVPCCSDDCGTVVLYSPSATVRPHLRHDPGLRPVNTSLGGFGEALLRLPSFTGRGAWLSKRVVRSLLASPPSTHGCTATMIRAGRPATRFNVGKQTDGPPPFP